MKHHTPDFIGGLIELLKDLISRWKSGTEVGIVDFDSGDIIKLEIMHSNVHALLQIFLMMMYFRCQAAAK